MRTTKDISLKDTSSFVLMEYSEEHPPIISNPGMGALVINYYRKTEPKDEFVPTVRWDMLAVTVQCAHFLLCYLLE
jgi:transcription initiation factor TFIID subunit 1